MCTDFIRIKRKEALELLESDPAAFLLLMLQSLRARWNDDPNSDNLRLGEAFIGKSDVKRLLGLTPQQYREVKKRNTLKHKKATYLGTPLGTRAKFIDNSFCVLFKEEDNTLNNTLNNTLKSVYTTHQQHTNNTLTTPNKERRKKKDEEDIGDKSPHLLHQKENRGGGGRKGAFVYEGEISARASQWHERSVIDALPCSADIIQQWIDEFGAEAVLQTFIKVAEEKRNGKKIAYPARYIGAVLGNDHKLLIKKIISIKEG